MRGGRGGWEETNWHDRKQKSHLTQTKLCHSLPLKHRLGSDLTDDESIFFQVSDTAMTTTKTWAENLPNASCSLPFTFSRLSKEECVSVLSGMRRWTSLRLNLRIAAQCSCNRAHLPLRVIAHYHRTAPKDPTNPLPLPAPHPSQHDFTPEMKPPHHDAHIRISPPPSTPVSC